MTALKLYDELADWRPLMSAAEDYEEEATFYFNALQGFDPQIVPFNHSELEPGTYGLFVCVKAR